MGKTRVIELIDSITDAGAESIVRDYVTHIDKSLFDICVLTNSQNSVRSANVRCILNSQVEILSPFGLKTESFFKRAFSRIVKMCCGTVPKLCDKAYIAPFVRSSILRYKPDVIHAHLNTLQYLMPISDQLKSAGVKIFYTCHSLPERYFNENDHKEQLEAARYLIENNGLRLIGLHDEMRCELNRMFGVDNTIVLHNCVDYKKFQSTEESQAEIRESLGVPVDAFVIGHVGRFIYIKNQSFLAEVFNCVCQKRSNAFLLMVGDGDSQEVEDKLKGYGLTDRYLILDHRSDMPRIYKAMDAFAFPSLFEGLPCACVEAQASGLRSVISSNITKDVLFDENAIDANISDSPQLWADIILDSLIKGRYHNDITKYDVNNVMKEVENLYTLP